VKGKDEYTWRKMNKRHMANDIYTPSVENETIGEVVFAVDVSGSIGQEELTEFATEFVSICELCSPESVRVLWWDTQVEGEQIFRDDYTNLAGLLKPVGGGGTKVGCVSEYINKKDINGFSNQLKYDLELEKLYERDIGELSGGELQRFAMMIVMIQKADVYIFDEPTSYLDVKQRIKMAKLVRGLQTHDNYIILVEHDLSILDYLSDFICCLYG
jgi:ABC-type sugar transport system ATPase subunit